MRALQWKEWRLSMSPVPLLFLLLSGLILIPNYPYYVTFFYNGLGLFMLMQSLRENRDTAYLMLLPVTKAEIEKIRGVKCDHAVNKLVEYNLVKELGRLDAPGRPILFGTTEEFLRSFGVQGLEELPVPDPVKIEDFKAEAEEEIQLKLNV